MTTRPPLLPSALLTFALLVLGGGADAQDAAALRDGVQACAAERRDDARLACYDALARSVEQVDERSADAGSPRAREPRRDVEQPQEILSTVASLREIQPGRLEITLANGQVWRQVSTDHYPLQVGHEVRVYPTRFGSLFRLTAIALRSFVQVERVR